MRPPRLAACLLKIMARRADGSYLGDLEEIYRLKAEYLGPAAADRWFRREALRSLPGFARESIRWRIIMLKHYLKTALRAFRRDKTFTVLNMAGLTLGLAGFILIMLWARDEVGWDRFHRNAASIHRVESNVVTQPGPLGPFLKGRYPEILDAVRYSWLPPLVIDRGNEPLQENGFVLADSSFFSMFSFTFLAGDPAAALAEPDSVVLTEAAARRYFGNEDPVGKGLTVEHKFDVRVTGVVRNPPGNSDFQFGILGEFRILRRFQPRYETHWGNHQYLTFVRLAEGVSAETVGAKIAHIVSDHDSEQTSPLTLVPLLKIHLDRDGARTDVSTFVIVALLILAVAAVNFINLTTARSARRAREIAVRQVSGARRRQLAGQFLSEAVLVSLAAFVLALIVVVLVLPTFNAVVGKTFRPADLVRPAVILPLLAAAAAIGLISGTYPALLLSAFRPAGLLKGDGPNAGRTAGKAPIRKILVVVQFAISTTLIISTLFIGRQTSYLRGFDTGVHKENVLVLPAKEPLVKSREAFLAALTGRPGVVNATFASGLPSSVANVADGIGWEGMDPALKPTWDFVAADDRYLDTLGLTLVQGRNFSGNAPAKDVPAFIINEKAAARMGIPNPVGKRFSLWGWNGTVIGVVKDFHFQPLREDIRPLLLFVMPGIYQQILVKISPAGEPLPAVIDRVREVWNRFAPGTPFEYGFLDAAYEDLYRGEQRMVREFKSFSFLGIFISCLGLIGLAAYVTEQKRREIGIRKILGASPAGILRQINGKFLVPILVSNLIAWPAGFVFMKTWLRGFAFHLPIGCDVFLIPTAVSLILALLTVSLQSLKAVRENPARALKYE